MDQEFEKSMEEYRQKRQEDIKKAKAELFAYLADEQPLITRITACHSGSNDQGWVDEIRYFGTNDESIEFQDAMLADLVNELFLYVTPEAFEVNEGGDGEIHIDPVTQQVAVEHNQYFVDQESNTYEA